MSETCKCPDCGAALEAGALKGVCPHCLLKAGAGEGTRVAEPPPSGNAPTSDSSELPPGSVFGDYELIEEIARGGMGVVFRARQRSLGRIVALKMILAGPFAGKQFVQRFRSEAATAGLLQHPNIVAIHEVGMHAGRHFFSMDYVEGPNLARLAGNRSLAPRTAARYLKLIAEAIHYAHGQGILHRDLKPSNVLIETATDQPRVTDFGLAKRLDGESSLTATGQVLGSPNFMPPEQAGGIRGKATRASDVYGLGGILYHLLTARAPFHAETLQAIVAQVIQAEPIAPRLLNPDVPRDLETICLKCLEKEPAKRYASAQELAEELDRFLKDEPILARPIGSTARLWRWCRRKPALAASIFLVLVLLLVLGIGGPVAAYRINETRKFAEANALEARRAQYASDMNLAHQAVQDGDFFRARQLLERHAPVRTASTSSLTSPLDAQPGKQQQGQPLARLEREQASPDMPSAERVRDAVGARPYPPSASASISHSPTPNFQLPSAPPPADLRGWEWRYLWKQRQGAERFILGTHENGVTSVGFLPDGKTLFTAGKDRAVRLWDFRSRRQLATLDHEDQVHGAACSPDGTWLVTVTRRPDLGQASRPIHLWDLARHEQVAVLTADFWPMPTIAFAPDSRIVALTHSYRYVSVWELEEREEIARLPTMAPSLGPGSPLGLAFSRDGSTLAYNEGDTGDILLWNVSGRTNAGRLVGHSKAVLALSFSADDTVLASGGADRAVRLWDTRTRQQTLALTNLEARVEALAFSPDQTKLAAAVGPKAISIDAKRGAVIGEFCGHEQRVNSLIFAPDSSALVTGSSDGTVRVWDATPRALQPQVVALPPGVADNGGKSGRALLLSPDGTRLLTVYTNRTFSVWNTLTLAEGPRHPLPVAEMSCAAIASGGDVLTFADSQGNAVLWNADNGAIEPFARPEANGYGRISFSPDGNRLAFAEHRIRVWDVARREERFAFFPPDNSSVMTLRFSPDGRWLLAGYFTGTVQAWDLNQSGRLTEFSGQTSQVQGLAVVNGGRTLAASGPGVFLWNLESGQSDGVLQAPGDSTLRCAASFDGLRLAVGAPGSITIWDPNSRLELLTLNGHSDGFYDLAFLPDGNTLVSVSLEELRVWRAASVNETASQNSHAKGTTP